MISIVYCTRETSPTHKEHLIKSSGLHKYVEVIEIVNNGESLTKSYNRGLKLATNNIVVFCHDDITVETKQWGNKLLKHFEKNQEFGIIGVAGTKYLSISGRWWNERKSMYGRVKHTHNGKSWLSTYSDDLDKGIEEVILVDGLFFAVDKNKLIDINEKGDKFDESVEGFHFYDVEFCFNNFINKACKIGVITNIRINHKSIGETNAEWEDNRVNFANKWSSSLPQRINEDFSKRKLKVMISLLDENDSLDQYISLGEELNKLNCSVSLVSNFNPLTVKKAIKAKVKPFPIQEPPTYKVGDGKFSIQGPNGTFLSEKGKIYKVGQAEFDVIYTSNSDMYNAYRKMYPECKFVDITSDAYVEMEKTSENYLSLFVKTFNDGTTDN